MKNINRIISCVFILSLMLSSTMLFSLVSSASTFENTLSKFPKSYQAALKKLHTEHPKWVFEPVFTNLDWNESVIAQRPNSVVPTGYVYSDMLKSKAFGDYNYSTKQYITRDSNRVNANDFAISYFMDPRNFLTNEGILQFEKLSFNSKLTQNDVEDALKGTFMYKAKASYYDKNGKYITVNTLYSKIIFDASKKFNIDALFFAKKIINEIGSKGSTATSGQNSTYPGIYNFLNIGANDGANAATRGLGWASSGTTYQRPWTSPQKAIYGGAEFLSWGYINAGQDSNYFQRFNVQPGARHSAHNHQYMTEVYASAEIAYSTYVSQKAAGTKDRARTFLIPIFENMPGESNNSGKALLFDSQNQSGTITTACRLRSGPSEYSDVITTVAEGRNVNLLEAVKTSSLYPESFLKYPVWAKISYTAGGESFTGYVYYNFINLKSTTVVEKGTYVPIVSKTNKDLNMSFVSNDANYVSTSDNKLDFLKTGSTVIYAYDSSGRFASVKYSIKNGISSTQLKSLKASSITASSAKISFSKNANFDSYSVNVLNSKSKSVYSSTIKTNSLSIKSLGENSAYKVYVRGISGKQSYPVSKITFTTEYNLPGIVNGLSAKQASNLKSVSLKWNKSDYTDGYRVYAYNQQKAKYQLIGTTVENSFKFTDAAAVDGGKFKVKSYRLISNQQVFASKASSALVFKPADYKPAATKSLTAESKTSNSITLNWQKVANATSYQIYMLDDSGKYKRIKTVSGLSYTAANLNSKLQYKFKVRAVVKVYDKTYYGAFKAVDAITLLQTPSNVKQTSLNSTSSKLSWKKVPGADGYRIYKYNAALKKYELVSKVKTNSYTAKNLPSGTTRFKIKAYSAVNGKNVYSASTAAIIIKK